MGKCADDTYRQIHLSQFPYSPISSYLSKKCAKRRKKMKSVPPYGMKNLQERYKSCVGICVDSMCRNKCHVPFTSFHLSVNFSVDNANQSPILGKLFYSSICFCSEYLHFFYSSMNNRYNAEVIYYVVFSQIICWES